MQSHVMLLLVPGCSVLKLACTVADNFIFSLGPGWIFLKIIKSRKGLRFYYEGHKGHPVEPGAQSVEFPRVV